MDRVLSCSSSVELFLELLLMLLVLVSHDVQNGISYDFDGLSTLSCLPSYSSGGCTKLVIAV